ncbi:hypothetical protein DSO57_1005631 [Entomophthora muscae]|uniref:Uncharacterized protein n=1 Tax=Entomophthora muscae TaxID=34485 RepID=A0ACC2SA16_9FUNG|nr:hypothetical protein DSO57_1005631 [Entomophthora muscae]
MNLNNLVHTNILSSPYFRELGNIDGYLEAIDEIYLHVKYLDPFATGSVPSSAFCLLFRLWELRLSCKQVYTLLDHKDSPYIRAIGFLYLRYVCKPEQLWEWFEPYLEDDEEFTLTKGPRAPVVTIGKFCMLLLEEQKFLGTMLPRIPVPIAKEIEKSLSEYRVSIQGESSRRSPTPERFSRHRSTRSPERSRYNSRSYRDDYYESSRDERRRSRSRSRSRSRYGSEAYRYSRY